MNLDSDELNLNSFDGYTSYSYLGVVIAVLFLVLAISAVSTRVVQKFTLFLGATASAGLVTALAFALTSTDISGLSKELEAATGIAMNHGASAPETRLLWPAPLTAALLGVLVALFVVAILSSNSWLLRPKTKKVVAEPTILKDSISLWDAQR